LEAQSARTVSYHQRLASLIGVPGLFIMMPGFFLPAAWTNWIPGGELTGFVVGLGLLLWANTHLRKAKQLKKAEAAQAVAVP
jgi:hypothetical protein